MLGFASAGKSTAKMSSSSFEGEAFAGMGAPNSMLANGSSGSSEEAGAAGTGAANGSGSDEPRSIPGSGTAPGRAAAGGALRGGSGRKSIEVRSRPWLVTSSARSTPLSRSGASPPRPGKGTAPDCGGIDLGGAGAEGGGGGGFSGTASPGSGTAPDAACGGAGAGASPDPGSGTSPDIFFGITGLVIGRTPGGFAPRPGSGTGPPGLTAALPSPALWTVKGFLHFGHLMERPAAGTRESSSS